jgi:hypothetical protein
MRMDIADSLSLVCSHLEICFRRGVSLGFKTWFCWAGVFCLQSSVRHIIRLFHSSFCFWLACLHRFGSLRGYFTSYFLSTAATGTAFGGNGIGVLWDGWVELDGILLSLA